MKVNQATAASADAGWETACGAAKVAQNWSTVETHPKKVSTL
ncbi:Uncharacterised protein [Mycobacterium tuberculosis]|nr:Uncharacterised protein [Mycobacterium tuberculosis]